MFRILRFVWKARRPSTVHDMPAVVDTFWLKTGYEALTFFGTIITHSQQAADHMNSQFDELKNHEMIHLKQAQSAWDKKPARRFIQGYSRCMAAMPTACFSIQVAIEE
jgi:hypothetical protein